MAKNILIFENTPGPIDLEQMVGDTRVVLMHDTDVETAKELRDTLGFDILFRKHGKRLVQSDLLTPIQDFIDNYIVFDPKARVFTADLYDAYVDAKYKKTNRRVFVETLTLLLNKRASVEKKLVCINNERAQGYRGVKLCKS